MQNRDRIGSNNPLYGKIKTSSTIAKITKLIYVYNSSDMSRLPLEYKRQSRVESVHASEGRGEFSTVNCSKQYNMGKDTLTKYIKNGMPKNF
jgi:hypothetical protein